MAARVARTDEGAVFMGLLQCERVDGGLRPGRRVQNLGHGAD
jgi:hypothetical protein